MAQPKPEGDFMLRIVNENVEMKKRLEILEEIAQWTAVSLGLQLGERYWRSQAMRSFAKERAEIRKLRAQLEELENQFMQGIVTPEYYRETKKSLLDKIEDLREKARQNAKPYFEKMKTMRRYKKVVDMVILPKLLKNAGYEVNEYRELDKLPEWSRKTIEAELKAPESKK